MRASEEERQISELVDRLAGKFPYLAARVVGEEVRGIHREFDGHRVREFIPLLVERIAERQLSRRVSYQPSAKMGDPLWGALRPSSPIFL
ncbi:three-helix bundle dimerization domain-containing protein [Nocardia sp. NPDC005978]|uniref:three-helix bundle dimerization domain-containing protein n=1 Tax=unclassified Nocardia TaxID=2637762 RepID=UPI0033A7C99B